MKQSTMTQEERTALYKRLLKILLELEGETETLQEAQDIIVTLMMDEKSGTPTAPVTPPYVPTYIPTDAPPNTPPDFPRKWWQDPWCYFKQIYKKEEAPSYTTPSSIQATITAKE